MHIQLMVTKSFIRKWERVPIFRLSFLFLSLLPRKIEREKSIGICYGPSWENGFAKSDIDQPSDASAVD